MRWYRTGDVQSSVPVKVLAPGALCKVAGCDRTARGHGLCLGHYKRALKADGDVRADIPLRMPRASSCAAVGCANPVQARDLCSGHAYRLKAYGDIRSDVPLKVAAPGPCVVSDCGRPKNSGDLCRMHRVRLRETGSLDGRSIEDRFWAKVEKTETCWLWTGKTRYGYGQHCYSRDRMRLAHRFAYEQLVGPIPQGLELDHLCYVRNCVNPDHLEPVTGDENKRRAKVHRFPTASPTLPVGTTVTVTDPSPDVADVKTVL